MQSLARFALVVIFLFVLLSAAAFALPWQRVQWGRFTLAPAETITVTGMAESEQPPQIATFTAGAEAVSPDKQTAINQVNEQVTQAITRIKEFGVPEADIRTQNMSVYQEQEGYLEAGVQRSRPGQWRANNFLEIKLRDVTRAADLANVLNQSNLTNVNGPNFMFDDTRQAQADLLAEAVEDARVKADKLAQASGRQVTKVLSITEAGTTGGPIPMFDRAVGLGGGGAPVQPGTGTVGTSVTVVFEVK